MNINIFQLLLLSVAIALLIIIKEMRSRLRHLKGQYKWFYLQEILKIILGLLFMLVGIITFVDQQFLAGAIVIIFGFRTFILGLFGYYRIGFCLLDFEEARSREKKNKFLRRFVKLSWYCSAMLESWHLNKPPH